MLHKRRGILAIVALSVLLTTAIGGAILLYSEHLPDPEKANQRDLLRWMIAKDVEKESAETQSVLARRLEKEFAGGVNWSRYRDKITDAQRERLMKNIPCVLRAWFSEKSETYEGIPSGERMAFLDQLIDTLEVWRGAVSILPKQSASSPDTAKSADLSKILSRELDKLRMSVPDAKRKQIDQLWVAVNVRWFLRNLGAKNRD